MMGPGLARRRPDGDRGERLSVTAARRWGRTTFSDAVGWSWRPSRRVLRKSSDQVRKPSGPQGVSVAARGVEEVRTHDR
jgi:hypothetical protein